jgi:branched-chain amino acid aminotransferase
MAGRLIWLNGRLVPENEATVSVFDHGLLYGDGMFEGIKSWDGKVFKLTEHIKRFYESAHFLNIKLSQTQAEMCQIVLNTIAANNLHQGIAYVRLVATRGKGDLGINPRKCKDAPTVYCIATSITLYPEEMYEKGLTVVTCNTRRLSVQSLPPRVKSLNYLNNILGILEANHAGADEGIMLSQEGFVAECTVDNIFFVKNGAIHTPAPFHGILQGITRDSIIDLARRGDYTVVEGTYMTFDIYNSEEMWLTGTGADLIPVVTVDGRTIGKGVPGPVFMDLRSKWRDYIEEPAHYTQIPSRDEALETLGMQTAH